MNNLRFVLRDGRRILQYRTTELQDTGGYFQTTVIIWKDVPLVDEDTGKEIEA